MKVFYDESIIQELWDLGFYPPEESGEVIILSTRRVTYFLDKLTRLEMLVGRKFMLADRDQVWFRGKID